MGYLCGNETQRHNQRGFGFRLALGIVWAKDPKEPTARGGTVVVLPQLRERSVTWKGTFRVGT